MRWLSIAVVALTVASVGELIHIQTAGAQTAATQVTASAPQATAVPATAPAPEASAQRPGVMAVELTRPQRQRLDNTLAASGTVAAWQEASVSPSTGGLRITRILVQVGTQVRRGDLLLEFDDASLRAELAQLKANVAEAQAQADAAERSANRARDVGDSGALSGQQLDQHLTAEQTARARLLALQEAVNLQQLRLRHARLVAPDDGVVSFRSAMLGAVVPAGAELFRIIRGKRLEWRAEVPARALSSLSIGTQARIVGEDGLTVTGTVRMVSPTVSPDTRHGLVYVELPQGTSLRPGMLVQGTFLLGAQDALALPQSAVVLRDGFQVVAQVGPDARVRFSKVGIGRRSGPWVEITSGLAPTTSVVARGAALLGDGDPVRVVKSAP